MLPRRNRLHRSADFRTVIRSGARSGGRLVVVHIRPRTAAELGGTDLGASPADAGVGVPSGSTCPSPTRVGLVVGRAVGGSVTRSLVSRRLRARLGDHLRGETVPGLPDGLDIVVRALPGSATASWDELAGDTDRCLRRAVARACPGPAHRWESVGQRPRTAPGTGS